MTIEGAIVQLKELIDNNGIPFWAKPSLQKVMETVEMEREQRIKESKTGKWMPPKKHGCWSYDERAYCSCSICGTAQFLAKRMKYCPNCGAKMEVDE